uniref:Uncharacterized protein n=1 Tax=Chlamydomonas euryale TaxID=1486919 RepID=A0A7R9VCA0_9CHLO|mmetsp:Transcript_28510/g.84408  ORF Transcript_28510/g.84408 Transcript_28510/m.84408 type:complete len:1312 (+) Transcript_28510:197-4132(+)
MPTPPEPEEVKSLAPFSTEKLADDDAPPVAVADDETVKDTQKTDKEEVPKCSFIKLFSHADRTDHVFMALGTFGSCVHGCAFPLFSIVFGDFVDIFGDFENSPDFMSRVSEVALYFVYIAIGALVAAYLQNAFWTWTSSRQAARLRTHYLSAVLRQEIAYFDTQATAGALMQSLAEDGNVVQMATGDKLGHFQQHLTSFVVGYIIAFWRGWDMALVMVGSLPFLAGVGAALSKMTTTFNAKSDESYKQASELAGQSIGQIRTVVAYTAEPRSCDAYFKTLDQPLRSGYWFALIQGVCTGGVNAVLYWTYALAFIYGGWRVSTGDYTGGDVMNVLIAALIAGFSLGQATPVLATFAKGCAGGARLFAVMERVPKIDPETRGGAEPDTCVGAIELRDVCFTYPARRDMQVLKNFSLSIPAGYKAALVGQSGSGKSTVAQLLERFYDPDSGVVLLDGMDLRQLDLKWLRAHTGLVSQEPTLFATTIFENILMGRPDASEEEVIAAAKAANANDFINRLPSAYQTSVGERGLSLSGGQKQRIAIARAILKNPQVMLLDEATSALDTESERLVQKALDNLVVGRTTIIIAHRLSTIQDADLIAVVNRGELVETGTHDELIRGDTTYASLVRLQMQAEQDAPPAAASGSSDDDETSDMEESGDVGAKHEMSTVSAAPLLGASSGGDGADGAAEKPSKLTTLFGRGSKDLGRGSKDLGRGSKDLGETALKLAGDVMAARADIGAHDVEFGPPIGQPPGAAAVGATVAKGGLLSGKKSSRWMSLKRKPRKQDAMDDVEMAKADKEDGGEEEKKPKPVDVPLSRLVAMNKPEWLYIIVGSIAAAAVGCVQPSFALIISVMITTLYDTPKDKIMGEASFLSQMFFTIGVGVLIMSSIMFLCFGIIGGRLAYRLRQAMFKNIMYQEVGFFDMDENNSSALSAKLSKDASYVRGSVGDSLCLLLQNLFCLAYGIILACVYDWRMALVVIATLPFMVSGSIIYYQSIAGAEGGTDKLYGPANQAVSDAFGSIRIVHAYDMRDRIVALYASKVAGASKSVYKQAQIAGITSGYAQFCVFSVYGLMIWFGGLELESGRATFEEMLTAFLAILLAAMGLAQSTVGFPDIGKAKGAIQSVFPLIDRVSKIDASKPDGLKPDGGVKGNIEFDNINFWYPSRPSVQVCKNFSLSIGAGQTCALVGQSGSGKSTAVGLVERWYDPQVWSARRATALMHELACPVCAWRWGHVGLSYIHGCVSVGHGWALVHDGRVRRCMPSRAGMLTLGVSPLPVLACACVCCMRGRRAAVPVAQLQPSRATLTRTNVSRV